MSILVSDYDGTLVNLGEKTVFDIIKLRINLHTIKNFQKNSNIFIISTGRTTNSIKKELETYNIPFNYLTAYNGLVSFDNNFNLINAFYIRNDILKAVYKFKKNYENIKMYDEYGNNKNNEKIILIGLKINNFDKIRELENFLVRNFRDIHTRIDLYNRYLWIHENCNKLIGLKILLQKLNIDYESNDIISFGNDENDYELLKNSNGYIISNSDLIISGCKKTSSIRKLIKKIDY